MFLLVGVKPGYYTRVHIEPVLNPNPYLIWI